MADHHRTAGELLQGVLQVLQGLDVQVVGGLIEQDDVAALGEGLGQVHPVAFTARQQADLLLLVPALEVERPHIAAADQFPVAHLDHVQTAGDRLPHRIVRLQVVAALVDIGQLHRLPEADGAGIRLLLAGDQLEQGRLAGAVGADHADDAVGGQLERQALEQHLVAVFLLQVGDLDHHIAQARAGGNLDGGEALLLPLLLVDHLVIGGQTRLGLGLAGLGGRAHPFQLPGHGALARLALGVFLADALFLLLQPAGIVALIGHALAAIELERPLGHLVQEIAVVGHQDDAAREAFQVMLQPGHGLRVQVVGGLVQQQHVRLGQQQPRQGHPATLTARQLVDGAVVGRAAQGVHGHLDLGIDVPQIAGVQLFLEGGHLLHQFVGVVLAHLGGDGVVGVEGLLFVAPGDDVVPDVQGRIELRLLLQIAHLHAVGRPGLAAELLVQPGHDLQQGRLARAVDPDHADLGVGIEGQPDVLEHLLAAGIGLGQALHLENILLGHGQARSLGRVGIGEVRGSSEPGRRRPRRREFARPKSAFRNEFQGPALV